MLIKQVQFFGRDERGSINCLPLLGSGFGGMTKTAEVAVRSRLHPKIQEFVRFVRPSAGGIYVLVNALGAGEYWGSNVNGDYFPEKSLIHSPPEWNNLPVEHMRQVGAQWPWGYPTFMKSFPYTHHQNKDPNRAFGRVELSVWNPRMKRVELVIYLDRELAKRFDAYSVIERIENGEFPDVSMGCKVPFDVCSLCGHQSKTRDDYCEHARFMMNKILPDGRKVCVINLHPNFFDISFVFIGADKTAKVMAKLAQRGSQVCLGDYCSIPRLSADVGSIFSPELPKVASKERLLQYSKDITGPIAQEAGLRAFDFGRLAVKKRKAGKEKTAQAKRQTTFNGYTIKVEYDAGDSREGKDKETGKTWRKTMHAAYGYIPKTKGDDGEAVDVYLRKDPDPGAPFFVVHQLKKDGSHDEDKVMLGFPTKEEAVSTYKKHVPDWCFGSVTSLNYGGFERYIEKRDKTSDASTEKTAGESCSCDYSCGPCQELSSEKVAQEVFPSSSEKRAYHRKLSEILKEIPAGPFSQRTLPRLENSEDRIPTELLNSMGEMDIQRALSTPGLMGIVLQPHEFQRIVLVNLGERSLADKLDLSKKVFGHTEEVDDSLSVDPSCVDEELKHLLMHLLPSRSVAMPALQSRAARAKVQAEPKTEGRPQESSPLLQKLASAYNGYRRNLLKKAASVQQFLVIDPQLSSHLFGQSMVTAFAGGVDKTASASVFGPESLAYLLGAHYQDRGFHTRSNEVLGSLAQTGVIMEAI